MQVLALCGLCLLCTAAFAQKAPGPEPAKSGAELEKAIKANVEAQDYQEETTPIKAQIIKGEPAALIASGTGDISTIGVMQLQASFHDNGVPEAHFVSIAVAGTSHCTIVARSTH